MSTLRYNQISFKLTRLILTIVWNELLPQKATAFLQKWGKMLIFAGTVFITFTHILLSNKYLSLSSGNQPQWNIIRIWNARLIHIYSQITHFIFNVLRLLQFQHTKADFYIIDCPAKWTSELIFSPLFPQCAQSKQWWWLFSTSWSQLLLLLPVRIWEVNTCSLTQQR